MADCATGYAVGLDYTLEYTIGCGDVKPDSADYQPIGGFTSKEQTLQYDEVDPTSDLAVGNIKETLTSYLNYELSGDVSARTADEVGRVNQIALLKHFINPTATGGKPYIWTRLTGPELTYECFMIMTEFSNSMPTGDVVTRAFTAKAASSPFGLIVTDTPVVP